MSNNAVTPGQRVELKIRGLGSTSGNVEMLAENAMVIALVVDPGDSAAALGDPDAVLEFPAVRGIYRQMGYARFDGVPKGSVRFVGAAEPEIVQRRDFARVDVYLPVLVKLEDAPASAATYETLNVSANGLLLGPPPPGTPDLKLGMFVWLKMELGDDDEPVEARGTVVRETGNGAAGVRYDHINEKHQEQIARFVFRQELEQRRKATQ